VAAGAGAELNPGSVASPVDPTAYSSTERETTVDAELPQYTSRLTLEENQVKQPDTKNVSHSRLYLPASIAY
jgi:hypothetical protein